MPLLLGSLAAGNLLNGGLSQNYQFDYFVDSVNGDDLNNGLSPEKAFATLLSAENAVIAFGNNARIGLARGSYFREKLTITNDYVIIGAYGSGNNPIIDCSNIISAGSWSKTAGYTNIYQVTLTVELDANAAEQPNLWINGVYATIVSSLATCDSTPGSIYFGSVATTSLTIYLHSTGSTSPLIDGKTYEAAVRSTGIDLYSSEYSTVRDVEGRNNYCSYGSIVVGRFCTAERCIVRNGSSHNMLLRSFAVAKDCQAIDYYHPSIVPIAFVAYEGTPLTNSDVSFIGCSSTVSTSIATAYGTGFYNHTGGTSFRNIYYTNCSVNNSSTAFAVANAVKMIISGGMVTYSSLVLGTTSVDIDCTGLTVRNCRASGHWGNFSGAVHVTLDGCDAEFDTTGHFRALAGTQVLTMTNCRVAGSNAILYSTSADGATFVVNNNSFEPAIPGGSARMYTIYYFSKAVTITSDYNDFNGSTGTWTKDGNTYPSLSAWQAGSGQDLNSSA